MAKLIFKCVRTGMNVQVCIPRAAPNDDENPDCYEVVTCPACCRMHLVNKSTGKMLSDTGAAASRAAGKMPRLD